MHINRAFCCSRFVLISSEAVVSTLSSFLLPSTHTERDTFQHKLRWTCFFPSHQIRFVDLMMEIKQKLCFIFMQLWNMFEQFQFLRDYFNICVRIGCRFWFNFLKNIKPMIAFGEANEQNNSQQDFVVVEWINTSSNYKCSLKN